MDAIMKEENTVKRCFEQRDLLTLLLAAPSGIRTCHGAGANQIGRLADYINGGNTSHFPAYELQAILSALAEECRGDRLLSAESSIDNQGSVSIAIDLTPRKRARRSHNNIINLHSILRFVERIIDRRYKKRAKSKTEDEKFLEDTLKGYFGTKDVLFQTEEEILCLAFEMALDAIVQSVEDKGVEHSDQSLNEVDDNNNQDNHHLGIPQVIRLHAGIFCDGVIKTALHIIESVVLIDIRERATRSHLQQAKRISQPSSNENAANRRKKYEHLLQPSKKRRDKGGTQNRKSEASSTAKSIIEKKYPKQWAWLHQFRTEYERKESTPECTVGTDELQQSHYSNSSPETKQDCAMLAGKKPGLTESNFVVFRRKIETLDDVSLSSDDRDAEMEEEELGTSDAKKQEHTPTEKDHSSKTDIGEAPPNTLSSETESKQVSAASDAPPPLSATPISPYDTLDQETHELRLALFDMPPSESSSAEVIRHTVDEVANLLSRYGEIDGAAGISRCGDILGGNPAIDTSNAEEEASTHKSTKDRFPLNDAMVSSLVKTFLTDATGALRAKAFLKAFVLPLMIKMNPTAVAITMGSNVDQKVVKNQGKPASRVLTALLASLARDRPIECVVSVVVPSLVLKKYIPSITAQIETMFEPTRFQCELISRALRGKDALSIPAITLLVQEVLPTKEETSNANTRGGMKWTEHSMPMLTACLNRQPSFPDDVVAKLADEISYQLSPKTSPSMVKNMKFSTLFHALVTKYGSQVKSTGRVVPLKDSATRLKTFMSKTIGLSLKKLS